MSNFGIEATGDTQIVITRDFAANVMHVSCAFLAQGVLAKWIGSAEFPVQEAKLEPCVGGGILIFWGAPDGLPRIMTGQIQQFEADANGCHVIQHEQNCIPEIECLFTVRTEFVAQGAGTQVNATLTFDNSDFRDAALQSGMGSVLQERCGRLDVLLAAGQ